MSALPITPHLPLDTILCGDALDVLRTLPDNSIDAIVTDPPAGISFMGKTWDSDKGGRDAWIAWLAEVMAEAWRVVKPGGHALVWALPRTSHWTAMALEDAGWEIRDRVSHLFGSGFPKSLDVSKAIDRKRDDWADIAAVVRWLEAQRKRSGVTRKQVERHFGTQNIGQGFFTLTPGSKPRTPTWEQWQELKTLLGFSDAMDAEVWRLNGRKGKPGEAWYKREVTGEYDTDPGGFTGYRFHVADGLKRDKPATDAARIWDGWGTSLKPALEDWWWVQKPLQPLVYCDTMKQALSELEAALCNRSSVPTAASPLPSTPVSSSEAKGATALALAPTPPVAKRKKTTRTGTVGASSLAMDTCESDTTATTCLSIVSSWSGILADLSRQLSTSTIATTTDLTTDLKTLSYSLSRLTATSMRQAVTQASGSRQLVRAVDALFSVVQTKLHSIQLLSVLADATDAPEDSIALQGSALPVDVSETSAGGFGKEDWWLCRKPLSEKNVAANVLRWGTGALNIGASRVGNLGGTAKIAPSKRATVNAYGNGLNGGGCEPINAGRWPANLLLSHAPECGEHGCSLWCPVRELDAQSGVSRGNAKQGYPGGTTFGGGKMGDDVVGTWYGDTGGASRYFTTFRYTAKASRSERNRGCSSLPAKIGTLHGSFQERGTPAHTNHHPTVKPLALMSWLITLITPPGGLVLDPFAGSGSTLVAAKAGGWRYLGIEREAEYVAIAEARLGAAPPTVKPTSTPKPKRAKKLKPQMPTLLEVSA